MLKILSYKYARHLEDINKEDNNKYSFFLIEVQVDLVNESTISSVEVRLKEFARIIDKNKCIPVIHFKVDIDLGSPAAVINVLKSPSYSRIIVLGLDDRFVNYIKSHYEIKERALLFYVTRGKSGYYSPLLLFRENKLMDFDEGISNKPMEKDKLVGSQDEQYQHYKDFFDGSRLLEFDTIIKIGNVTLFENFVRATLEKPITDEY